MHHTRSSDSLSVLRNLLRYIRPHMSWLLPADENIWFHRQVAYQMLFWTMVHTTAHYVNFINVSHASVYCMGPVQ